MTEISGTYFSTRDDFRPANHTENRRENQKHKFIKIENFNFSTMLNEYFMISIFSLVFFGLFHNAEIKITPGSVSTDDDHLNFIGGEWWELMMRGRLFFGWRVRKV